MGLFEDETVASGEDAGWIDRVSFVSADRSPPLIGRQPISRGVSPENELSSGSSFWEG